MSVEDNEFTKEEGFEKTYAHYLLFKKDSPMLNAVLNGLFPDDNDNTEKTKYLTMFDETLNKIHVIAGLIKYGPKDQNDKMREMLQYVGEDDVSKLGEMQTKLESNALNNKKTLDVIHEVVITYLPTDYFLNQSFQTKVYDNLNKSFKLYLNKDTTIAPKSLPTDMGRVTDQLKEDKVSQHIYDEDKIIAVAAFYGEAHNNVDKDKAILSVAYAYEKVINAIKSGGKTRKPRIFKKRKTHRKK